MMPIRVLVVEDEGIVGRDVQSTLAKLGYEVPDVVDSGERALELIDEIPPDLVIMDIQLAGDLDGIDTAERMQEKLSLPHIYLTGYSDDETVARARKTKPYGYLLKPFNEKELQSMVEMAVTHHGAQQQLEESERQFLSTLNSMAEGVISTDLIGRITYLNPLAEELTGWPAEEAVGLMLHEVFQISHPSGESAEPLSHSDTVSKEGRPIMLTTKEGELVPVEDNTTSIRDEDGSLTGLVVLLRRRQVDLDDQIGELPADGQTAPWSHLVGIVQSISDPLVALDSSWNVTYVNNQASAYFEADRSEIIGKNFWDVAPPPFTQVGKPECYDALLNKEQRTFELHHDSQEKWLQVRAYPFSEGLLVYFLDVTASKEAEEQQSRVEKLESLGFLARGFAHDFNNLLTVLLGNLSLAAMRIPDNADYRDEIDGAKRATLQAQGLVQQLLTFAKGGAPIKRSVDLVSLLENALREYPKTEGVDYSLELPSDLAVVLADPGQIRRVLANLLKNSAQAIKGSGGKIELNASEVSRAEVVASGIKPNDELGNSYVRIQVIDNGEGIPKEHFQKIFEPYFSTRDDVHATGIGLTVCESIAKAHHGFVAVESVPDEKTTVSVFLPVAGSTAGENGRVPIPSVSRASGRAKILILEDEPLIRQLLVMNLQGYEVIETSDGADTVKAYAAAQKSSRKIDLCIMDLTIPGGVGGKETIEKILKLDPEAVAIVSSGYSGNPVMANYRDYGFKAVLPKPYSPQQLQAMVRDLLGK